MKASSAITTLRNARRHMEESQFCQVGSPELYALMAAYEASNKDKHVGKLLLLTMEAMAQLAAAAQAGIGVAPGLPGSDKAYEALRAAYKALETVPADQEFKTDVEKLPEILAELKKALGTAKDPATDMTPDEWEAFMVKIHEDPKKMN